MPTSDAPAAARNTINAIAAAVTPTNAELTATDVSMASIVRRSPIFAINAPDGNPPVDAPSPALASTTAVNRSDRPESVRYSGNTGISIDGPRCPAKQGR